MNCDHALEGGIMAQPDLARWTFPAFALVCLFTLGGLAASSGATSLSAAAPTSGCWTTSTGAPVASPEVRLNGIAALSSSDVWAVGSQTPADSRSLTLIEHW